MRSGGCTLMQQALNPDAAAIVKQAVALAQQRGHAQVTPLHVANTMLSSSAGPLPAACLKSRIHPLQCKALELCFNVALNRLPAASSSSGALLGAHYQMPRHVHSPTLSNALVAAFKRAQAHQRRGSAESQQQPLLAVKIELEQLVISILDDPSVSRVMREAGFSSTQVKTNIEKAVSKEEEGSELAISNAKKSRPPLSDIKVEDVQRVVEAMSNGRKRSIVVIGESLAVCEAIFRRVVDKVENGDVPETMRAVQFRNLSLSSFEGLTSEEVEQRLRDLRCFVKGTRKVAVYLGDLKYADDLHRRSCGKLTHGSPLEHAIVELGKMALGAADHGDASGSGGGFWLMGIATQETYIKCRSGHPSLESFWGIHAVSVAHSCLELRLNSDSAPSSLWRSKRPCIQPQCWSLELEETRNSTAGLSHCSATSTLPLWLQQNIEGDRSAAKNGQSFLQLQDLCKNRDATFGSTSKNFYQCDHKTLDFFPVSASSSVTNRKTPRWQVAAVPRHPCLDQHCFWSSGTAECGRSSTSNTKDSGKQTSPGRPSKASGYKVVINSSPSDAMEIEYVPKFKELNAENVRILCSAFEEKVPWQKEIIPEIASTILRRRAGMLRRKNESSPKCSKEETWLLFLGNDLKGKQKIAREIANLVFGSYSNYLSLGPAPAALLQRDDCAQMEQCRQYNTNCSYFQRFADAIGKNSHFVVFMELDTVHNELQLDIKGATESGRIRGACGQEVNIGDAIVVLSCESLERRSRGTGSNPVEQELLDVVSADQEIKDGLHGKDSEAFVLDLNISAGDAAAEDRSPDGVETSELVDGIFFFKSPDTLHL